MSWGCEIPYCTALEEDVRMTDYMSVGDLLKLMWRASFGNGEDTPKLTEEGIQRSKEAQRSREASEATHERRAQEAQEKKRRQRQTDAAAWQRRLETLRNELMGSVLATRYDWIRCIRPILLEIDSKREVEGLVVVALSRENRVVHVRVLTGSRHSVSFSIAETVANAQAASAAKVILGHCHPSHSSALPSDQDVESAAALHFALQNAGLELADDLVVCKTSEGLALKSTLATHRFKQMVCEY